MCASVHGCVCVCANAPVRVPTASPATVCAKRGIAALHGGVAVFRAGLMKEQEPVSPAHPSKTIQEQATACMVCLLSFPLPLLCWLAGWQRRQVEKSQAPHTHTTDKDKKKKNREPSLNTTPRFLFLQTPTSVALCGCGVLWVIFLFAEAVWWALLWLAFVCYCCCCCWWWCCCCLVEVERLG